MQTKKISLKIVVDNEAMENLVAEHGFALWLEIDSTVILFDTGQGRGLLVNAERMGLDLGRVEKLVLSHGHYDHTGGLSDLLHLNHKLSLYCHAGAFLPRYSIKDGLARPVKISTESMTSINSLAEDRLHWVTRHTMLSEDVGISGEIPRNNSFETTGGPFYFDRDGKRTDTIVDDMALWINTPKGLIICIGCCHAGILNTVQHIMGVSGQSKIHTIIGGLHLLNADDTRLEKTIAGLKKLGVAQLIPCHCTGETAHRLLAEHFSCTRGFAGLEIII